MDPLADKVLVSAALLALVGMDKIPSWFATIVIARELMVTGIRLLANGEGRVIAASIWGKVKTITQIIAISLLLIDPTPRLAAYDADPFMIEKIKNLQIEDVNESSKYKEFILYIFCITYSKYYWNTCYFHDYCCNSNDYFFWS